MLKIRSIWKATELKRFNELERKYHYMGETHSGGDTLRLVIEDDGEWVAIMVWGTSRRSASLSPRGRLLAFG